MFSKRYNRQFRIFHKDIAGQSRESAIDYIESMCDSKLSICIKVVRGSKKFDIKEIKIINEIFYVIDIDNVPTYLHSLTTKSLCDIADYIKYEY